MMNSKKKQGEKRMLTVEIIEAYGSYLKKLEKSQNTIKKYMRDIDKLFVFAAGRELTKELLIEYKESLINLGMYKGSSINSFLVAANRLFEYMGWYELKLNTIKIQREVYCPENRELTKGEYPMVYEGAEPVLHFVQDNQSFSSKGVLRGLHFQKEFPQGKLVRVIQGAVYDVAVDLRTGSSTYGKYYGIELTEDNFKRFYIPKGFAHGFVVLSDTALFSYKCTDFYHPNDEGGLMWNDPDIGIDWSIDGIEVKLSEKDKINPTLR